MTEEIAKSEDPVHVVATQTQCYGLFGKRSAGTPKAVKLIDDRVYWDLADARVARASMDSPDSIEIRSMVILVECAMAGDRGDEYDERHG